MFVHIQVNSGIIRILNYDNSKFVCTVGYLYSIKKDNIEMTTVEVIIYDCVTCGCKYFQHILAYNNNFSSRFVIVPGK